MAALDDGPVLCRELRNFSLGPISEQFIYGAVALFLAYARAGDAYGLDALVENDDVRTRADPPLWRPSSTEVQPLPAGPAAPEAASRKARRFFVWPGPSTTGAAPTNDAWTAARTTEAVARTPAAAPPRAGIMPGPAAGRPDGSAELDLAAVAGESGEPACSAWRSSSDWCWRVSSWVK